MWLSITVGARCLCVKLIKRRSALKEFLICTDKTDKEDIILLLPSSYRETEKLSGTANSTGKLYHVCEISAVNAGQATMLGQCPSLGSFSDDPTRSQQKQVPLPAANISDRQPHRL